MENSDIVPAPLKKGLLSLTKREWDVLMLLAEDLSNSDIADQLCVRTNSIKSYKMRIGEKLECSGRGALGRLARRHKNWLKLRHSILYKI